MTALFGNKTAEFLKIFHKKALFCHSNMKVLRTFRELH